MRCESVVRHPFSTDNTLLETCWCKYIKLANTDFPGNDRISYFLPEFYPTPLSIVIWFSRSLLQFVHSGLLILYTGAAVQRAGVLPRQLDVRRDHVQGGSSHPIRQRRRVTALHSHDHYQQVVYITCQPCISYVSYKYYIYGMNTIILVGNWVHVSSRHLTRGNTKHS